MLNKKFLFLLLAIIANLLLISHSISKADSKNELNMVINEIGAFENSGSEWIEILNVSDNPINLDGWKFWEQETKHGLNAFQGDLILESNEFAIIADEGGTFLTNNPNFTGTIIDSSWTTLSEDGEEIGLIDHEGNFIELFTYLKTENFSLERKDPNLNIYTESNWQEHLNSHTGGYENSNFELKNTNSTELTTQNPPPLIDNQPLSNIQNFSSAFNGTSTNLSWTFPESISKALILKNTQNISATLENQIQYSKGDFIEGNEIIAITNESFFKDYDFEEEQNYFYEIFSLDDKLNYSDGETTEIKIPYLIKENDIVINEFVSNPENDEEWIELFNKNSKTLDLNKSFLMDESGTKHFLDAEIKSKTYFVIENPKFNLNNSGDSIIFYNQYEQIIDQVSYGSGKNIQAPDKAQSAGLFNQVWMIFGNPTKETANKIINHPPKAIIKVQSGATTGEEKVTINLDGSDSYDPDGDDLKFHWDFGDNTENINKNPNSKTFDTEGEYNIILTVTDAWNEKSTDILKIVVEGENDKSNATETNQSTKTINDISTDIDIQNKDILNQNPDQEYFYNLQITELLPNPEGEDSENEWIEIFNNNDKEINLSGLFLDDIDGGSKAFALEGFKIKTKEYLIFQSSTTKITLNQSNDSARLITEDGQIIDEVFYKDTAEEGFSYALINDEWIWTDTQTPAEENISHILGNFENNENDKYFDNLNFQPLFLNEIFPNPFGRDNSQEWIEIYNPATISVNLKNWSIDDSNDGSKIFTFEENLFVPANGFFTIYSYDSKLNLNNNIDEMRLFNPNNLLQDQIKYEKAEEGLSLAKFENEWIWTDFPTPNTGNIFSEQTDEETNKENNQKYLDGDLSDEIFLSEIMPNPKGKELDNEWIEIFNASDKDINLGNWYLMDNSKSEKKFIFSDKKIIKAKSYLTISRQESKIALDNNEDHLFLYDFEEELKAEIEYKKSIEGQSYAMVNIINENTAQISSKHLIKHALAQDVAPENYWTWVDKPSPGRQNQTFYKFSGKVAEKLDQYLYLQISNDKKIQVNLENLDINNELSENLLQSGSEIEILAEETDKNLFNLKEFSLIKTANAYSADINQANTNFWLILIPALLAGLTLGIWRIKENGMLKKILHKLAEVC